MPGRNVDMDTRWTLHQMDMCPTHAATLTATTLTALVYLLSGYYNSLTINSVTMTDSSTVFFQITFQNNADQELFQWYGLFPNDLLSIGNVGK